MKLLRNYILIILIYIPFIISAQEMKQPPNNWQLSAFETDSVYGVDAIRAYEKLKNKKAQDVIVAVLDSGMDVEHPALINSIWKNKGEIQGNGLDDDNNGYIDDVTGWNFLGSKNKDLTSANLEVDREYYKFITTQDTTALSGENLAYFNRLKASSNFAKLERSLPNAYLIVKAVDSIVKLMKVEFPNKPLLVGDLAKLPLQHSDDILLTSVAGLMETKKKWMKLSDDASFYILTTIKKDLVEKTQENYDRALLDAAQDYRAILKLPKEGAYYGNNHINQRSTSDHGMHVAGIIAGKSKELNGIAKSVKIMPVRIIPAPGDEYDLDVANGIRYAVDNGAQIINMSFGKYFSPQKKIVDAAIKYAESKNVLLVLGAGNDFMDLDESFRSPSNIFLDGTIATNLMTVGATDYKGVMASFSNFGKNTADVFAPGVHIYSSVMNGGYAIKSGTSMAAPVVSGVAALLLSYYPELKPQELIALLRNTATIPKYCKSVKKGYSIKDKSISGGIVNAYKAVEQLEKNN